MRRTAPLFLCFLLAFAALRPHPGGRRGQTGRPVQPSIVAPASVTLPPAPRPIKPPPPKQLAFFRI
jgi:hypothetical protein